MNSKILRIENPLIDSPDDPFIDLGFLIATLGEEQARRIAMKFSSHIENTGHWQDELAPSHPSVRNYIAQASAENLGALYFNVYPLLDDPSEVQMLRAAGFDGAIYGGSGENAMEPKYRVFSEEQVLAAVEADWPIRVAQRDDLAVEPPAGVRAPKSTIKKVRAALAKLVGEGAVRLGEGLGRLVVTTSEEIRADGHFQMSSSVLASFAGDDFFEEMLAEQRAVTARAIALIGDVGDCAIVRSEDGTPRWKMILRDASEPGKWRTQSFDLRGLSGHTAYPDRDAAIEAAASSGFTVRDDMALDRIQDSPQFQRGLYATDLIDRVSSGVITHNEADRMLAEYDECHRVLQSVAATGAQAFVADGGEVMYLLADRILEGTEGAVFLHEIVHRYGRRILGEAGFGNLVMRVKDWSSSPVGSMERLIHDAASARARAASGKSVDIYDEELFAYGVEEAVSRGVRPRASAHPDSAQAWLDQVVGSLRAAIRASMGSDIDLSVAQDVVDLAYAFAQLESPERTERILQALSAEDRAELSALVGRGGLPKWYSGVRLQSQAKQRSSASTALMRWFGDSKVVDEQGQPLVVFHGGQKLTAWNSPGDDSQIYGGHAEAVKREWGSGLSALERERLDHPVHFFTDDEFVAQGYGDQGDQYEVRRQYLQMERPMDLRVDVVGRDAVQASLRQLLGDEYEMPFDSDYNQDRSISQSLRWNWSAIGKVVKALGYDGIILYDTNVLDRGRHTSYAVFEPTQIKSADTNRGTFDPDNPDIRYSFAGRHAVTTNLASLRSAHLWDADGADAEAESTLDRPDQCLRERTGH